MVRENASHKARRYLVEGRVIVTYASTYRVKAQVRGVGGVWFPSFHEDSGWQCDCPTRSDRCSHLIALRLVTAPTVDRVKEQGFGDAWKLRVTGVAS